MEPRAFDNLLADISLVRLFKNHPQHKMLVVRLNTLFDSIHEYEFETPTMLELKRLANLIRSQELTPDQRRQLLVEVARLMRELKGD